MELGETNSVALVDALETHKSVVSRYVRRLEEAGLLLVRVDRIDGRARMLSLTPHAIERLTFVTLRRQNLLHNLLRRYQEGKIRAFATFLRLINQG